MYLSNSSGVSHRISHYLLCTLAEDLLQYSKREHIPVLRPEWLIFNRNPSLLKFKVTQWYRLCTSIEHSFSAFLNLILSTLLCTNY